MHRALEFGRNVVDFRCRFCFEQKYRNLSGVNYVNESLEGSTELITWHDKLNTPGISSQKGNC